MNKAPSHSRSRTPKPSTPANAKARTGEPRHVHEPPDADTNDLAARGHAVRVLCVDDHAVLVEGLAARFALEDGIELVGRLASATRLVEACDRLKPNVVILDIEMPGPDAFEMADRLKHRRGDVRVMVLSAHIRDAFISAAFRAGASAYFSKADDLAEIIRGIYEVAKSAPDEFLLGPKVRELCRPVAISGPHAPATRESVLGRSTGSPVTVLSSLTSREAEILRLIGKGMSRTQIAAELCRSAKTVDAHQARMMKKLGITARADLMRLAIREGLAEA
jgi:DNA-binding NarL/FixJ family response regulator